LPTAHILLLVNYRPEYQHGWGSKSYYTRVRLDPLPPTRADELLQALLGDDPSLEALTPLLIARTEGNPLFLEESVRTLAETGVLTGERGAYHLAQPVESLQMPATVQAVLAARIDRLTLKDKHVLQCAAVVGTDVPLPLLQAIAERPEAALHHSIEHLQAAAFRTETRLFPERAYTFKHVLTHEVAYGSLLQERRRTLHARIVEALEALAGERVAEQVERLAHHALRGEVWDQALTYCRQAGEKALAQSAYREAVGYFEQALQALAHLPETRGTCEQAIDLRLALRNALTPSGDQDRIVAYLRQAECLATALSDPRRLGQVCLFLSFCFTLQGAHDQAIAAAQRARTLAMAGGELTLHALAILYLGRAAYAQGDYHRAIDCFRETGAFFEGAQHRTRYGLPFLPAVTSRAWLAVCHAELGTFAVGRAHGDEGLRIAEAVAHPGSLMWASWWGGLLAIRHGDLPRAIPLLERAMGLCQDADIPAYLPSIAAALGAAYTMAGRDTEAGRLLTQALHQPMTPSMTASLYSLPLAEAQVLAGHLEEAQALADRVLALTRAYQERGHQAHALRLLGDIAARREPSEHDQAEDYYRQALALAEELGMRPLQAHCHRGLGTLDAKVGRPELARAELTAAIALYRAMDMTFWLPQAEATIAQIMR
jgi:tetratricopeptide (TPR) repeat protein